MTSAAPPGNTDSEYVIGSALKCPQFECIKGQTFRHICSLLYRLTTVWYLKLLILNILKKNYELNIRIDFYRIFSNLPQNFIINKKES
jgi:hypothetical protein